MSYEVPYTVQHPSGGRQTGKVRIIADNLREATIKARERVQWSTGEPADAITTFDPVVIG